MDPLSFQSQKLQHHVEPVVKEVCDRYFPKLLFPFIIYSNIIDTPRFIYLYISISIDVSIYHFNIYCVLEKGENMCVYI